MRGFIKVSREFLENKELNRSAEHLCLYVHILSRVSFSDDAFSVFGGKKVSLCRGQMVTSVRRLAEETGISKSKIERILDLFKKWDVIRTECGTRQTLITVAFENSCETENGTESEISSRRESDKVPERKDEKRKEAKEKSLKESISKSIKKNNKKKIYGSFENVRLTDEEFESFKAKFPHTHMKYIEDLSLYIASKGDKYKSHYATLLAWNRDKSDSNSSFDTDEFFQASLKRSEEHIRKRANEHKAENSTDLGW